MDHLIARYDYGMHPDLRKILWYIVATIYVTLWIVTRPIELFASLFDKEEDEWG